MDQQVQKSGMLRVLVGLLLILLAFVAVTFYLLTRDSRHEQIWIGVSTDVQVLSQQLANSATEAAAGNLTEFYELGDAHGRIADAMIALKIGDTVRSLPPLPDSLSEPLDDLNSTWERMSQNATKILDREALVVGLSQASASFIRVIPQIQEETDKAMSSLTRDGAPGQQIFVAGRQLVLADRILRHLNEILRGGGDATSAAESFAKEIGYFEQMLNALLQGSKSVGVTQVRNTTALNSLAQVRQLYTEARPNVDIILASSSDLVEARGAADEIYLDSQSMFNQSRIITETIRSQADTRMWPSLWSGVLALIIIVAIMAFLAQSFLNAERTRALAAGTQNQRNQAAILRLLDEMSSLADGDLTVHATVTDDMTGAIADSVNFAVEQLRELVTGIKYTAMTVAESAQGTENTTSQLAEASVRQAAQVRAVTETINDMALSLDVMAKQSRQSSEVAQRSVEIASSGSEMVQQTIKGMDNIRDQIQETSKRLKRLGESSQEIGDIVELIDGIAEQTNILALNAAIQSASAGGAGRGFAVVADEVQRLAERASNSTRRIEMLVQNIQADTAEAVVSMESTTTEVVSGAKRAEDAGEALKRIETVSNDLSRLIEEGSTEAQEHSETATKVAGQMTDIRDVSIKTSEGTKQTAKSMGTLAELVRKLSESVADFKLPKHNG
jgi:twitching motility protein PilJ